MGTDLHGVCALCAPRGRRAGSHPPGRLADGSAASLAEEQPQATSALRLNVSEGQNVDPRGHQPGHGPVRALGILSYQLATPLPQPPGSVSPPPSPGWGSLPLLSSGSGVWGGELLVLRAGHVRGCELSVHAGGQFAQRGPDAGLAPGRKCSPLPPHTPHVTALGGDPRACRTCPAGTQAGAAPV